ETPDSSAFGRLALPLALRRRAGLDYLDEPGYAEMRPTKSTRGRPAMIFFHLAMEKGGRGVSKRNAEEEQAEIFRGRRRPGYH
ncbi:MAG: hypothetical protein WC722_16380, partial [Rhodospirillales bacterium]